MTPARLPWWSSVKTVSTAGVMVQSLVEELRSHRPSSMAKKKTPLLESPAPSDCPRAPSRPGRLPPSGYLLSHGLQVGLALQQLLSQAQGLPSALLLCPLAQCQAALQLQQLSAQPGILAVQHLHLGESGHRQDRGPFSAPRSL